MPKVLAVGGRYGGSCAACSAEERLRRGHYVHPREALVHGGARRVHR